MFNLKTESNKKIFSGTVKKLIHPRALFLLCGDISNEIV